ncbi:tRNA N(3)-methylcytidine methyltransferase METTL2-like isoform X2 [Watersipora subatra]|uniref:tRNA N(3)-methylcytidine methyltransferase METTL2-like isoform X2 n=1 Tax=Watersipora subatra TaxID=2589382 RepID=UPI00355C5CC1
MMIKQCLKRLTYRLSLFLDVRTELRAARITGSYSQAMASSSETETDGDKRPQFGNRYLTDEKHVFQHNAWDNVCWDDEQEKLASEKVSLNSATVLDESKIADYEEEAAAYWNKFYGIHQNGFFKDRNWLFTEFPELYTDNPDAEPTVDRPTSDDINREYPGSHSTFRILEVGCGAGNTVFPVLSANRDPRLFVYCCDFSETAVTLVKENEDYDISRCHCFVSDIADTSADMPFPDGSLDIITMIFVLSAISPQKMQSTLTRMAKLLKPGGVLLFRDYGRYDLAQLRFKKGQCLGENFYARGDGTRVYFFTQDEMKEMLIKTGLEEECNLIDRRLQVNRGKQLKMYRVWIQCKYKKPKTEES